jgi:uncharacterized protein YggE
MKTILYALAIALNVAPALAQQPPPAQPVVVTNGEGIVRRAPDRAWVTIAAESRAKTAQDAQRTNTEAMTAVMDKIKGAGVPPDAIQTTGYNLQPEFDYANGRQTLRDYVARNQVQVRVDTLAKMGDVLSAAVGTGATNVSNVRFDLRDRDQAEREALRLAVRDARARADAAASGAGVQIDRVVRIDEQREVEPIRPMPMAMARMAETVAAPPPVPIEAGEIEIRAHVTLAASIR